MRADVDADAESGAGAAESADADDPVQRALDAFRSGDPVCVHDFADREGETVDGFSGHADRQGLENFVRTMNPRPEKVLCVHGDERSTQDLSSALYHEFNMRTFAPKNLETFRFK